MTALLLAACGQGEVPSGGASVAAPQVADVSGESAGAHGAQDANSPGGSQEESGLDARLWFPDADGNLAVESRVVRREPTPALQARALIDALLAGPGGDLTRAIPADTSVRALHIAADGTAYVDLSRTFETGLSAGSEDALLAVRSIVRTLTGGIPEVHRVRLLVEGEEVESLGGHLDLTRPLGPEGAQE